MKTWMKVAMVNVVVAAPAFFLDSALSPLADTGGELTTGQIPFFLSLAVGDALLLGLVVSFLLFGLAEMRKVSYVCTVGCILR